MLSNAGTIEIAGGHGATHAGQAGAAGGLLDVLGTLTDTGTIIVRRGGAGVDAASQGQGGRLVVSGTLSITGTGSLTVQGGNPLAVPYLPTSANGGVLTNAGLIDNAGVLTVSSGRPEYIHYGASGLGGVLSNTGTMLNSGTISVEGGVTVGFQTAAGGAASLIDSGVLTNTGSIVVGSGQGGTYLNAGGAGGALTVTGTLTNLASLSVLGGQATDQSYATAGSGGTLTNFGSITNFGTIEIGAGVSTASERGGFGAVFDEIGTLVDGGSLLIDGSKADAYLQGTAGTLMVSGFAGSYYNTSTHSSSGTLAIGGGGGGQARYDLYGGLGGVLVVSGVLSGAFAEFSVGGGQGGSAVDTAGGSGGTISVLAGGDLNTSTLTVQGGGGASASGAYGAGGGGVLDVAGSVSTYDIVLQGGTAGSNGGAAGTGAAFVLSGSLFNPGTVSIDAGAGGGSASLTVSGYIEQYGTFGQGLENDGALTLTAGAEIQGGTVRNNGIMSASGTITEGTLFNDTAIDVGAGTLLLDSETVTSDGGPGVFTVGSGGTLVFTDRTTVDGSQSVVLAGPTATLSVTAGVAGVLVTSPQGGLLQVAGGGTATLDAADTNLGVMLLQATNLTLGRMGFIDATGSSGADTITALAANQTLTGGLGADRLTGAAATGDTFRDIAAGLNGDTIAGFAGTDTIDITDFAPGPGLVLTYAQHGATGMLTVSEGSTSTSITLQGQFTTASFTTGSDAHGGVLIGLHG